MSQIINRRCDICDTTIKYASYWSRHCKTKKHMKNALREIENEKYPGIIPEHTRNIPEHTRNIPETYPVNTQKENKDIYGRCKYCNNGFKTQPGLSRHQNHRCKQRPQQTQIITNNNTNTNSNNTNTTNSNNTTNNTLNQNQITLNVYGEETIPKNFLTNDLFEKLKLCNGDLTKTYLLLNRELYLKNKKNNNIKYTNIQSEYCQILSKDNNWILKRLLEVMNERGIIVKNELERELERIIEVEGIKKNQLFPEPKMKDMQIMYMPLEKFHEETNEEDEEIKELYKKYQIELYNLKKKRRIKEIIEDI